MNKYIIITARSNSSRLKNKILKKITKKYKSIDILIRRAQKTNFPICLATTTNKSDDKLVNYVKKNYKIDIFRGSEGNKVLRWVKCIEKFNIDYAALVDGDDLAFDYTIYKNFLTKVKNKQKSTVYKFPEKIITGSFTYIFDSKSLKLINKKSGKIRKIDVIEFFLKYLKNIKEIKISKTLLNKKIRLTLDYKEDLKFFRTLYKRVSILEKTKNIVEFLEKNDNIRKLNYHLEEFWRKNQLKEVSSHEKRN